MNKIFDELANIFALNNYSLYMIGSSSRDYLLNKEIKDYDFVTDATPLEINSFLYVDLTFQKYGVVKLKYKGFHVDIATFRKEYNYEDNRHPNKIEFIKSIEGEYLRRDFTINCIYIDSRYRIIDPTNKGILDLNNKVLRFVKPIKESINEDPLRILRAFRFKEEYNLNFIDGEEKILIENIKLLDKINKNKILEEKNKYLKIGGNKYYEFYK